ncbi:MAG: PrpR N-terminal domain-containing protein, partial [Lachnospiraceae bacterium]|nr:PrpR N-terminal domain-containing protein [Lachnospiraceae bacterium]
MKYKIGIILHYGETEDKFSDIAKTLNCKLFFEVGVMDYAIDVAIRLEKEVVVDAIIASTATANIIKDFVSIPVIPLHIKDYNVVEALIQSKRLGKQIAFCDINPYTHYNLSKISSMLDVIIKQYPFHAIEETNSLVQKISADNADVVVTPASCMFNSAKKHNMNAVLIRISEQDIIDAIETAKLTIYFRSKEIEKNIWMASTINQFDECVITTDKNGNITLINKQACMYLDIAEDNAIGKNMVELQKKFPL